MNDCTVVCVTRSGKIVRFECEESDVARKVLQDCERSGRYVSGSIWTADDQELEGFVA